MASSSSSPMKHQVFLSFRGEDTRHNFTSYLYEALKGKGLDVFFDEEILEKGEGVSQACSKAIAASNVSLVVLSEEYASSKTCLAELSVIMHRKRAHEHVVLPIFYHVDPSLVRKIGGSFMTSFEEHESNRPADEVKRWKSAFVELGNLKGWHIGGKLNRSEIEQIKDIVEYVIHKLRPQVFLSFRGEDTRLNFTSYLLKALNDKGINVFSDEVELVKGEQLSQSLSQAIGSSNLSLIVLSVNYASSKLCLAELSDIMDRKDTDQGYIVFPIFYHINPSDVRNLGGIFKTLFDDHESKRGDQVQRWKAAFSKVGALTGWHIGGESDRPETEYIKEIVEDVVKNLKK